MIFESSFRLFLKPKLFWSRRLPLSPGTVLLAADSLQRAAALHWLLNLCVDWGVKPLRRAGWHFWISLLRCHVDKYSYYILLLYRLTLSTSFLFLYGEWMWMDGFSSYNIYILYIYIYCQLIWEYIIKQYPSHSQIASRHRLWLSQNVSDNDERQRLA